jgi:AcrR family transcriptional regulator
MRYTSALETLRERKKRRTREHLSRVAMKLFADRGLQAVTVEEICERAEVSARTFFRYFPSKEDVVFTNDAARRAIVRDALASELPGETLSAAARRAVKAMLDYDLQEDRDTARLRARLLDKEPALARHLTALTTEWTQELSDAVAQRLGGDRQARSDARLAVGALIGVLNAAGELWLSSGLRGDPHALMNRALAIVEVGLSGTVEAASLRAPERPTPRSRA